MLAQKDSLGESCYRALFAFTLLQVFHVSFEPSNPVSMLSLSIFIFVHFIYVRFVFCSLTRSLTVVTDPCKMLVTNL